MEEQLSFPFFETESIAGIVSMRIHFGAEDVTLWCVSKNQMIGILERRVEAKKLSRYEMFKIVFDITKEKQLKTVFETEHELSGFLGKILDRMLEKAFANHFKENPYSPTITLRTTDIDGTPAWFFSGENFFSDPFTTIKGGNQQIMELSMKEEIKPKEKVVLMELLSKHNDIPKGSNRKYDA
ncbi:MAG TPA: hypothetical protein VG982_01400 [Candidatus Paceibacterota bacterium]|nr:hypothetical protein [Candidatus Paceibacterota bacterium]